MRSEAVETGAVKHPPPTAVAALLRGKAFLQVSITARDGWVARGRRGRLRGNTLLGVHCRGVRVEKGGVIIPRFRYGMRYGDSSYTREIAGEDVSIVEIDRGPA